MKKQLLILLSVITTICLSGVTSANDAPPVFDTENPVIYGKQLVEYSDRKLHGWKDELVAGKMSLYDTNGQSVLRSFRRIGLERFGQGDKSIIKFTSPADIKGVAALNYENSGSSDDNWLYLPSTKKVRRISGANNTASFQGSEFTYEDLNDLDPAEYQWQFLKEIQMEIDNETLPVFKIEGKPTYRDTAYSYLILYLSKDHWFQAQVEYFDKSGTHLKTRTSSQWQQFHNQYWRALQVEMANHQTGKKTVLKFSDYLVDLSQYTSKRTGKKRANLTESFFTKRALTK